MENKTALRELRSDMLARVLVAAWNETQCHANAHLVNAEGVEGAEVASVWQVLDEFIDTSITNDKDAKRVVNAMTDPSFTQDNGEGLAVDYIAMRLIKKRNLVF